MLHSVRDFGDQIHETALKKGLRELNPNIHFDMGANLNLHHPRVSQWQGVFHNGKHIVGMSRGLIPEYNVYATKKREDGTKVRSHILFIGWRTTLEKIVRKRLPGITWETLRGKFGVDYKLHNAVAEDVYDPEEARVI